MQLRSPTAARSARIAAWEIMAVEDRPQVHGQDKRTGSSQPGFATKGGWTRVPRPTKPDGGSMSDRRQRKLGRRSILKGLAAGTAAAAVPSILVRKASAQEKTLRIVQWKHFVPDYDRWFTQFAQQFGEKNKCTVQVDYVATPDLPTAIAADISRGGGHDVFHLNGTGAWLYEQALVDVSDVATRLEKEFGPWIKESESIGKVKGKWLAIPSWYISYPLIINTGYFKEAGAEYTDKTSWQDLIKIGAKLKKAGHPF